MNAKRQKIHDQIFSWGSMALVFVMPVYGKIVPSVIFLIVLNWLIEGKIRRVPSIFKERKRMLVFSFAALYIFYMIGMAWSKNLGYGLFDLEVKFSLLLFPLIFATVDKDYAFDNLIPGVFKAFVAGCLLMTLILFGIAIVAYLRLRTPDVFFYTYFTRIIHPSYLAMYLNLAITILMFWLIRKESLLTTWNRALLILLVIYFFFVTFLLSSKAGIISLVFLFLLMIIYFLVVHRSIVKTILLSVMVVLAFYGSFRLFPSTFARFEKTGSAISQKNDSVKEKMESNTERLVVWKAGLEVIRKHPVFGVGTGDVKDALLEEYQKEDKQVVYNMRLNAHNQYLQTFISLGIFGVILIVFLLAWPGWIALRRLDVTYFSFLAVFGINIFVESMLEVQAGVVYYAFFNALLFTAIVIKKHRSASPSDA